MMPVEMVKHGHPASRVALRPESTLDARPPRWKTGLLHGVDLQDLRPPMIREFRQASYTGTPRRSTAALARLPDAWCELLTSRYTCIMQSSRCGGGRHLIRGYWRR
jgi:hypothetical protein